MYMRESQETLPAIRVPVTLAACLIVTAAATLAGGIWPGAWLDAVRAGVQALFS